MTDENEAEKLRERIATKVTESDATIAAKRLIALDVSRGDPLAQAHYGVLGKAQVAIELELEILTFAIDALSASPR